MAVCPYMDTVSASVSRRLSSSLRVSAPFPLLLLWPQMSGKDQGVDTSSTENWCERTQDGTIPSTQLVEPTGSSSPGRCAREYLQTPQSAARSSPSSPRCSAHEVVGAGGGPRMESILDGELQLKRTGQFE